MRTLGCGTQREQLIRAYFTMKNVAVGQAVTLLDIDRAEDLTVDDGIGEIRGKLGHGRNDSICHLIFDFF